MCAWGWKLSESLARLVDVVSLFLPPLLPTLDSDPQVLNSETVPRISAPIVCGAANNQLEDPSSDYGMAARGITYVPDFVCNRMGIVNCSNEQVRTQLGVRCCPNLTRNAPQFARAHSTHLASPTPTSVRPPKEGRGH